MSRMLGHYLYFLCRWKLLSAGQFKVEGKLSIYLTWHMYTSLLFPGITFFLNAIIQYRYVCPCDTLKTFQQGSKYFNSVTWTSLSVPSCLNYLENCFKLTFSLELWWPRESHPEWWPLPLFQEGEISGKMTLVHPLPYTSEMTRCFVQFSLLILWLHSHITAFWTVAILGKDILLPNVKSSWGLAESFGRKGQSSSINVGFSNLFSNHMRKIDLACFHQLSLSREI